MATTENRTATTSEDDSAIAELDEIVERQRAAFLADPFPSLEERQELLGALAGMLLSHRTQIQEAMSSDFGVHPRSAADLIEVLGPAGRAVYAAEQLGDWMASEPRPTDPALYGSGRAFVQPQPKGVIGNIVPWNFPFDLSVGPLIEMLAAGNRVVIKPSEYTPACAELLREMIHATFDRDRVDVVVGGLELARAFTHVRWDHLLYTGSPAIGREIAKAAAEQLVPVTLELGRQVPGDPHRGQRRRRVDQAGAGDQGDQERADVHLGRLLPRAARAGGGLRAPGRRPRARVDAAATASRTAAPGSSRRRHLERIQGLLEDARTRGCDVRPLEEAGDVDPATRQLPISLVIDPPDDLALMQEEIFGPILPIKAYDTLEEAIDHVNAGERPLALYVFAKDEAVADEVLRRTTSGGACVNSAAVHGALPVAALRRHRPERLRPPPRHRGLPRVLQPARRVRPRRGRPDRGLRASRTGRRHRRSWTRRSPARPDAEAARGPYLSAVGAGAVGERREREQA